MKKTIAAVFAAATLIGASACSTGDDTVDNAVSSATDAAGSAAAEATSAAGDAMSSDESSAADSTDTSAADSTDAADGEGADGEGADGADGAEGAAGSGNMVALPGAAGVEVPEGLAAKYQELGGETGYLGAAEGEPETVDGKTMQRFAGGALVSNADGQTYVVQGKILERYLEEGGLGSDLGAPTADEQPIEGGWKSTFENGEITYMAETDEYTVS